MSTLKTIIVWEDAETGAEQEADVTVTYTVHRGFAGSYYQPPEPASVEITDILQHGFGPNVPERFFEDDDLLAECWQDYVEDQEAAAEQRAESIREERMLERSK